MKGSLLDDNSIWDTTPSPTTPPTQPVVAAAAAAASGGLDLWGTNDSTPAVSQNQAPKAEEVRSTKIEFNYSRFRKNLFHAIFLILSHI